MDGALAATKQADNLGKQYDVLHKQLTEPERSMTVCDICGVFINSTDNEQRRLVSGGLWAAVRASHGVQPGQGLWVGWDSAPDLGGVHAPTRSRRTRLAGWARLCDATHFGAGCLALRPACCVEGWGSGALACFRFAAVQRPSRVQVRPC